MKKRIKIVMCACLVIICVSVIFLVGRKMYYNSLEIEPYEIYVESKITNQKIKLNSYSYQWNDKGIFVIGDGNLPKIEEAECFKAEPGEKIYFSDYEDTSVVASTITLGNDGKFSVSLDSNNEENYFILPNISGKNLIGITLTSEKKGTANYAFVVDTSK